MPLCYHLQDTKHHPASVDLELVKRLVATTKCSSLQKFLVSEFSAISKDLAGAPANAVGHPDMSTYCMHALSESQQRCCGCVRRS